MPVFQPVSSALILAAGRGKRLMPFTGDKPKCLVEVGNRPILFYQLRALEKYGIRTITITTGYQAEQIKAYAPAHFPSLEFRFVHNDRYETTNDIYSFYLARDSWSAGGIVLDSDVLFHPTILAKLIENPKSTLALRRGVCGDEEMKIVLTPEGCVGKISKELAPAETVGESLGISLFRDEFNQKLLPAVEVIVQAGGVHLYREAAIENAICEYGGALYGLDVTCCPAIEIDFPEDLERAEKGILPAILPAFAL